MRVLNDFHCVACDTTKEYFMDNTITNTVCLSCGGDAMKLMRPVNFSMDANHFSSIDKWEKMRKSRIAEEKKRSNYDPVRGTLDY